MELTIQIPDEFKLQAEAHGLAPESYAEKLLRDDLEKMTEFPSLTQTRAAAAKIREMRRKTYSAGFLSRIWSMRVASIDAFRC